jgi:hypothetical protein
VKKAVWSISPSIRGEGAEGEGVFLGMKGEESFAGAYGGEVA